MLFRVLHITMAGNGFKVTRYHLSYFLQLCILTVFILLFFSSCTERDKKAKKATYVQPSVDYRGRYRKGHVRMPVSTKKDAIKNQSRSRYYYQTRGKYRRKSKED